MPMNYLVPLYVQSTCWIWHLATYLSIRIYQSMNLLVTCFLPERAQALSLPAYLQTATDRDKQSDRQAS